ncbi:MAG: hypothetical protein PVS3B2_13290 [Candidatus Dormibacteraceae bacterium]
MVVDDEERARISCDLPEMAREREQLTTTEFLVPKLQDISSATRGCDGHLDDTIGWRVRGDDVKVSGEKPL